jgi:outer membrane protein assembly factor BamB
MKPFSFSIVLLLGIVVCMTVQSKPESNWTQFRGPSGGGIAEGSNPPSEFGPEKNMQWKTELVFGLSSPVVWDSKIFVTGYTGEELQTICINRSNGEILWSKTAPAETIERTHPTSSPAASTPVVDADHVYVYFGSFGLLCYDHDGSEKWQHPVSTPVNMHGTATSPIVYKEFVYLMHDSMNGDSFMLAVNKNTGDEAWKTKRAVVNPNWSSPVIWNTENGDELIMLGGGKLQAYDPMNGKELWAITGFGAPIPVPIIGDGVLFASTVSATEIDSKVSPFTWDYYVKFDKDNNGIVKAEEIPEDDMIAMDSDLPDQTMPSREIISWLDENRDNAMSQEEFQAFMDLILMNVRSSIQAIKPGVTAENAQNQVAWKYERSIPYMPSSLFYDGIIYLAKDGGIVTALDAKTGDEVYRKRVGKGNYSSSPVAADDRIYISSQEGIVTVFQTGKEPKVIAENDLGEPVQTTPAIVGDTIYIRTQNHLYAFAK